MRSLRDRGQRGPGADALDSRRRLYARAGALAAADEGVRRGARGRARSPGKGAAKAVREAVGRLDRKSARGLAHCGARAHRPRHKWLRHNNLRQVILESGGPPFPAGPKRAWRPGLPAEISASHWYSMIKPIFTTKQDKEH